MRSADAVIDSDGNPAAHASAYFEGGSQLPFGRHKGYALMVAVEAMGRVLAGSDDYADLDRGGPIMRHQGVTMIVARADAFRPLDEFGAGVDELMGRLRSTPAAPGCDEVLAPGDPEKRARVERSASGIPVPDDVWQALVGTADSVGENLLAQ